MGFFDEMKKAVHRATAPDHHREHHSPQSPQQHGHNHDQRGHYPPGYNRDFEYYAVVDKSSLFWSGEMPDISFGHANLCKSYDEMINKLTQKLNEAFEDARKWRRELPRKTSYHELQAQNPGKQIAVIYPTIRF